MTANQTRDKMRAVFLAALMVISVFGGTVAFAGTAAANVESLSMAGNSEVVQSGDTIWVSGSASNTDDITFTITDGDGDSATETKSISSTDYSVSIDLSSLTFDGGDNNGLSEGPVTIEATQDSSDVAASTQFEVDDTSPTISGFSVSHDSGLDVNIEFTSDEELSTVSVDVTEPSGTTTTLDESDFGSPTESDGDYVYSYTYAGSSDGKYSATLNTAADEAGNDGASSESDSVTFDGPNFNNFSPTSSVSDNQSEFNVDITDADGVDESSISVQIQNSEVVFDGDTSDSGVYYIGDTLTVDPSGADVPDLPDGDVTVVVTALDNNDYANRASHTFNVDTTGPIIDNPHVDGTSLSDSDDVNNAEPEFKVDTSDANSDIDPKSLSVTITDADGNVLLDGADDGVTGVSFTGSTLTVDSSKDGVASIPDGEVTYTVSLADEKGNENSEEFTFEVDTVSPQVDSAIIGDGSAINADNNGAGAEVTVEFSEEMATNDAPTVAIIVDGNEESTVSQSDGWSNDGTSWTGTTDSEITGDAEATIKVIATSAEDPASNTVDSSENTDVFVLDTVSPAVSTTGDFPTDTVEGTVNVTTYFQIDSDADDVVSETYEYSTDSGSTWTEISDAESFDTTQFDDGDVVLRYTAEDDVSNSAEAEDIVTLDNNKPSVTTDFTEESILTGTVDLTEHFSAENVDGDLTYEYKYEGDSNFQTVSDETAFDVSGQDGNLTLKVTGSDAHTSDTAEVQVTVDNLKPTLSDVEGTENGTVSFNVTAESELQELEVTVNTSDDYSEQSSHRFTLDDFEQSESDGTYTYSLTTDHVRDGEYDVELKSAVSTDDRSFIGSAGSDLQTVSVDHHDPMVVDAQIVDAGDVDGDVNVETEVLVKFNEPVDAGSISSASIEGSDASFEVSNSGLTTGAEGEATLVFDDEIQTGDLPNVTISAGEYSEVYTIGDEDADTNGEDDKTVVHTLELNLEEGHNVVSVPAASGTLDLTELDALTENDTVWAYDDGEWQSYTPGDNQSDFTTLEGGQGYIFVMDSAADVDVNVYNLPGSSGDVASSTPQSEEVHEGWNLLGHWQEGGQSVSQGLSTIGDDDYSAVYEQTENGELSFTVASDLEPGEGYWVFVTEDDGDVYGEQPYATSD